jgi:hypothetical protein
VIGDPTAAVRALTLASPIPGLATAPPDAAPEYRRLRPVTQRTPAPCATPGGALVALPVQKTVSALAFSPVAESTRLSDASDGDPEPARDAPPDVAPWLLQPRSTPEGALPHGQATTPPLPGKQKGVIRPWQSTRIIHEPAVAARTSMSP